MFEKFTRKFSRRFARELDNRELADLPTYGWENPKIDVGKYYVTFTKAWQVSEEQYDEALTGGLVCQQVDERFYVTNG